ncbi:MAG: sodium-independent anion transporter, partial [Flavobacteriales bacterium]
FAEKFDVQNDPSEIIINFKESRINDMSAIDAVHKITERYANVGKTVRLRYLSADCKALLKNADGIIEVNIIDDPTYRVAASPR